VAGARPAGHAARVARAVANSPLVKTAFFGRDANWGRIVQAAGQAVGREGAAAAATDVLYEDLAVVRGGQPVTLGDGEQERLADIMAQHEIDLRVGVNGGGAGATIYFSDLTHDYVTLNAEYTT
jgi:glutamate N-acetyltransferase/amino-acid N-acetyltransferase